MKRILLITLIVLGFALQGWGADYIIYIDADAVADGAGTEVSPYDLS